MPRTMVRSSFRPRFPRQKRGTEWVASFDVTTTTALAAAGVVLDQIFTPGEQLTVVRTVGYCAWGTDQVAASEDPFGALGFMVVRSAASTAGIGSVPTPITEEGDDGWFGYVPLNSSIKFADATGFQIPALTVHPFDIRAQRKMVEGDTMIAVLENASAGSGAVYILKFRQLLKLHA